MKHTFRGNGRKQGERLGGCHNNPGEHGQWLGWGTKEGAVEAMRSGQGPEMLRRGDSRFADRCDLGCEKVRGIQCLWPENWEDGAALSEMRETLRAAG